ncbi:MAG: hypothetical protein C7B44_10005 [Sulfobacillus thermosulfidooxidans]|nr:MAG: hypothetical protein C7B44_10005 [Sulfobacillus thermosulfidooxidans]
MNPEVFAERLDRAPPLGRVSNRECRVAPPRRRPVGNHEIKALKRASVQVRYVEHMLMVFFRRPKQKAKVSFGTPTWAQLLTSSIVAAVSLVFRNWIRSVVHLSPFGAALVVWIVLFVAPVGLGYVLSSYVAKILRETMVLRLRRYIARAQLYINNGVTPPVYDIDKKPLSSIKAALVRRILSWMKFHKWIILVIGSKEG